MARHVCDVRDLGRKKTKAVADKVCTLSSCYVTFVLFTCVG